MKKKAVTLFGIIRHAPTKWNERKIIQGQQDSSLSLRGQSMAEAWGIQLREYKWDLLLCSDLNRVQETARLVNLALNLPTETEKNLREQDWGSWAGMTLAEVKAKEKDLLKKQEQKGWDFRPPRGESRTEVLERCKNVLAEAHDAWPEKNILVVTHEGVIKCLLYHLLGRRFLPDEPKVIEGYKLHLLTMEEDRLSLQQMNRLELTTISPT